MLHLRQMQYLKRMENGLAIATEQLKHTQSIYNNLQAQVRGEEEESVHAFVKVWCF